MDEKFEHIIKSAENLFKRYSIRSVSMEDVAKELGISKKTLYHFVCNKSELIQKIMDYELKKVEEIAQNAINKKYNAIDTLLEISRDMGVYHKDANPSVEYDLMKYYPELYTSFKAERDKMVLKYLKENIKQGIGEGYYRSNLDADLIASLYIKKIESIIDPDFFNKPKFSFTKVFKVMFENHIRGIANEKGIAYFEQQKESSKFKF